MSRPGRRTDTVVTMLIAEDLLLLLTDDESGKFRVDGNRLDLALAGACVIELAMLHRIDVAGEGETVKPGRLVVRDETPTSDDVLDGVLRHCARLHGAKPKDALGKIRKGVRPVVLDRLTGRGLLRREQVRILGIFPATRWPAVDSSHEQGSLEQLRAVLLRAAVPDSRIAALVGLLSAVDAAHKVIDADDRKAVRRRAREIRESQWATEAVGKAVEAVESAVMIAVVAGGAAAGAGGS